MFPISDSTVYFNLNNTIHTNNVLEESDDAFLVLVRQAKTGSTSDITYIYCISMKTKKPIKNCVLNGKFNHLEVCIDGSELSELDKMKDGLKSMPNIVVVGGEDTTALLLSLGHLVNHNNEVKPVPPFKKIALLSMFLLSLFGRIKYENFKDQTTMEKWNFDRTAVLYILIQVQHEFNHFVICHNVHQLQLD